jgi:hypothetical protein
MAGVPHTFGPQTSIIPLSYLDDNFNTQITVGSTSLGLGNAATGLVGTGNIVLGSSGTWTPADVSGAGLTLTVSRAAWLFIGTGYWCDMAISYPVTGNASAAQISLPATVANVPGAGGAFAIVAPGYGQPLYGELQPNGTYFGMVAASGGVVNNSGLSNSTLRAQFLLPTI